jgi:hypothetical protein
LARASRLVGELGERGKTIGKEGKEGVWPWLTVGVPEKVARRWDGDGTEMSDDRAEQPHPW